MTRGALYTRLVLMAACWGGQFIAGRVVAPLLPHFTTGALRFLVACAGLLALCAWRDGGLARPTRAQWPALLALGVAGIFCYNAFFFAGLERITAGRAALMMALMPAVTTVGAWLFFGERMHALRVLGIAISLAGVAVVLSHGDLASLLHGAFGAGEMLMAGAVLSWTAYTLIGRTGPKGLTPLATTTWAAIVGTVLLAAVALFESPWSRVPTLPLSGWIAIFYLGIFGTVLAFLWYLEGVRAIGGPRTAVFINLVPVFAVAIAAVALGERIDQSMVIGGLTVIAGVMLTNRPAPPPGAAAVRPRD
jgi:drug/metabolite transporter (DMT)-like permease